MSKTLRLMRGAVAAQANGWFALYYRATWAEAENLWRRHGIARIIGERRRPGDHANGRHRAPKGKDRLRQKTDRRRWSLVYAGERFFGVVPAS